MTDARDDQELSTKDIAGTAGRETAEYERAREAAGADRGPQETTGVPGGASATPLFASEEAQRLRARWDAIQTGFVDEPRRAVEDADSLVAQVMKRLAEVFAEERSSLERQWDRGDDVSTEDLRIALQRYRSFFQRLLSF
jgi:6-phosphogluconolactonase/glucosamine-6-phosphate isomerase/deaminase